jgi:cysteine desulfurase
MQMPIYMDNQATTRVDPRVVEAMLPFFTDIYGNSGSATHSFGLDAKAAVETAREKIASAIGAKAKEIVFTNGATESNNLAIFGVAEKLASKGRHIVSVTTEHPSVLEPLEKLALRGFDVTLLPVIPNEVPVIPNDAPVILSEAKNLACIIRLEQIVESLRDDTILVSVMLANNEIGAIQPLAEIGRVCKERGIILHTDATQAVGKIPVDVEKVQVDLMSFSAHKIYGPKGVGALYVRRGDPPMRLEPLTVGGGQESGLRSGTLNVPGIVGFARAVELCIEEMPGEQIRLRQLRDRLYQGLKSALPGVSLNGPTIESSNYRLPGNLNVSFENVDGESLLVSMKDIALSSGSACTSSKPGPSHVLRALGLSEETVRSSIRFGLGRFNTIEEVDFVVDRITQTVNKLRGMIGNR